jgi:predicted nucleotidyltransferase
MQATNLLEERREEVIRIAERYGAESVRIFGSVLHGDAGPDSDLDLLVNLQRGRTLLDIVALKQDLEDLLGCDVDIVTEASLSPYIRDQVLREAVAL